MYHKWLDKWDERRAQRGDAVKKTEAFAIDANLGFPDAPKSTNIADFCVLAEQTVADPSFFEEPNDGFSSFETTDGWVKFASAISTDILENNVVWAKVTESGSLDQALVVFHHWNASKRNRQIASYFSRRGITVVEIAMPYHFERSRPGALHADYILSPNIGRTIQSTRQAVLDGRRLIGWLKSEGYGEISVLGMSLGSWVAGMVAAHDPCVSKASLFLTAGSLADMVWTGRATRAIRESLEPEVTQAELRQAWAPINLENYADLLARPDLDLQIVLAKRDKVVLPELSLSFVQRLKNAGATLDVLELNCGHYSLAMPPHIFFAGFALKRLLRRGK